MISRGKEMGQGQVSHVRRIEIYVSAVFFEKPSAVGSHRRQASPNVGQFGQPGFGRSFRERFCNGFAAAFNHNYAAVGGFGTNSEVRMCNSRIDVFLMCYIVAVLLPHACYANPQFTELPFGDHRRRVAH